MNESYIRNVVEAALLAAGKSLQLAELGQLFDEGTRPKVEDLQAALAALAEDYANRGLEVKETAAGFRIQVRKEFSSEISRLWPERPAKYSRALLETLALIAYRQPITRAEIEAVRGVAVNPNIVKTVIERNWVRVVGHRDVPGRPELLGTTRDFLDYFGLRSLDELPALAEVKALGDYNLQLELPNASAEGKPAGEGGEGAAAVAGLLTDESGAVAAAAGGEAAGDVAVEGQAVTAEVESVMAEGEVVAESGTAVENPAAQGDAGAADAADVAADADAPAAADAEGAHDAASVDAVAHATAEGDAESHEAHGDTTHETDAAVAHDATHDEAEADRTLSSGEHAHRHTAESDEADASESDTANESLEALDEASDDDGDEDELSADGHGSRELVAAPRDTDN